VRMIWRVIKSVVAWVVILLIVSAALELAVGRRMPALAGGITLTALAPVVVRIWSVRVTRPLQVVWGVAVVGYVGLLVWQFSNI